MAGKIFRGIDKLPTKYQTGKKWCTFGLSSKKTFMVLGDITYNISLNPKLFFVLSLAPPTLFLAANPFWLLLFLLSYFLCLHLLC